MSELVVCRSCDAGNVLEEQQAELSTDNYFAVPPDKKKPRSKAQKENESYGSAITQFEIL